MTRTLCGTGQILTAMGYAIAAAQVVSCNSSAQAKMVRPECDLELVVSPPITAVTARADWQRLQDLRALHGVPQNDFRPLPTRN